MSAPPPKKLETFPDVEAKLQKAHKQSAFEKEKADREAKRRREAAETAAVYESFVKSFDHDDDDADDGDEISAIARGAPVSRARGGGFAPVGGVGKRHFGTGLKSGPGSLGPAPSTYGAVKSGPGSLGPSPTTYGRKRGFDGGFQRDPGHREEDRRGRLGGFDENDKDYDSPGSKSAGISRAFDTSDGEGEARTGDRAEERAVAKPTLRLASLPPGTSPAVIKALIPPNLTVENVKVLPPGVSGVNERKSMAAIVVLSQETPATDIDAAVSLLQNRYLGYGFYLSLHRHLSSAVATTASASLASASSSHPFGAKPVAQVAAQNTNQQIQAHRGFAPPTSYAPPGNGPINRQGLLHVPIQAPKDVKQLQLIHKVVESVLEHGPEFEALLMSRHDVQREEKWAWLWDARSEGGVWYRWRLWEVITKSYSQGGKRGRFVPIFEGSHAWKTPEKPLLYEYATDIREFVSDSEYNSSDEDDYEEEGNKQIEGPAGDDENAYLNPLDKTKLVHLLARLPAALSGIRKGDVARVTTFAITHASRGADEIVDLIVSNVQTPFTFTSANPERGKDRKENSDPSSPAPDNKDKSSSDEQADTSAASLVGLYIVSDILSSSATSGVRHSWRYRQLFETSLRERKVFEHLGLTAERLGWGRLRADKWKRSVGLILSLWEGWCVFPADSQELFVSSFENPPSLSAKKAEAQPETAGEDAEKRAGAGRWKTVDPGSVEAGKGFKSISAEPSGGYDPSTESMDVDDDVDGEIMDEAMNVDELMDSDIDGKPMSEDEDGIDKHDGDPMDEDTAPQASTPISQQKQPSASVENMPTSGEKASRRRMRAVDMFADDDEVGDVGPDR